MKISKQALAIGATVLVIAGGSATAAALSGSSDKPAVRTVQVGDTASPSAPASASSSPTPSLTATSGAASTPTATTSPTSAKPSPTPTKKAATMATPTDTTPTTSSAPAATSTDPATAGQNNGGSGTVDHGPYPSKGPQDTASPSDQPIRP